MRDMDEVLKVELTKEEYVKNVIDEVFDTELCVETFHKAPALMLFAIMFSEELWVTLSKYSRLKTVADIVKKED